MTLLSISCVFSRADLDDDVRRPDFTGAGAGYVGSDKPCVVVGDDRLIKLVERFQLFVLNAAVRQKAFYLMLVKNNRFRIFFPFFNHLIQRVLYGHDGFKIAGIVQSLFDDRLKGFPSAIWRKEESDIPAEC